MKKVEFDGHAHSFLPEGKSWQLVWHDEFDGDTLDESKWNYRLDFWGKRFETFTKEGVILDGKSNLQIHLIKGEDGNYHSGHLQTGSLSFDIPRDSNGFWPFGAHQEPKFMHKYGYYEIRCRFPKCDGWHSAFWLQAPGIGSHPNPAYGGVECDIMENYRLYKENIIVGGNIWGGYGKNCKGSGHFRWPHVETDDRWHYYGVDWNPDGYTFYIDGKAVGRITPNPEEVEEVRNEAGDPCGGTLLGAVSHIEQFLLISTECGGYRSNGNPSELLKDAVLPDYFEVDHVRVFDDINLVDATVGAQPIVENDDKPIFMF